jgi:hypothetical protein
MTATGPAYVIASGCTIDRLAGYINVTAKTTDGTVYLVVRKNGAAADSIAFATAGVAIYSGVDSTNTATFNPGQLMEMAINFGTFVGTIRDIWIDVFVK